MIDATHDRERQTWCPSANDHAQFPLQNLPLGIFSDGDGQPRGGIRIGEHVLDLLALADRGLLRGTALEAARLAAQPTFNAFFAAGAEPRRTLRRAVFDLLSTDGTNADAARAVAGDLLRPASNCRMHMPVAIGDYTDFYAGIHHATNAGGLFRPDEPLLPNYRHVPIAYHGRASSVRIDGTPLRRPVGQILPPGETSPIHAPSARLDFEAELGILIGTGNALGEPIAIEAAAEHIAGYCLLNDWSARDLQSWEYRPLGPFTAKNFLSTLSAWVVTPEALAPFRRPAFARNATDPTPLPYLVDATDQEMGGLSCEVEVLVQTAAMADAGIPPHLISSTNTAHLYWTAAQMIAHHTTGGCDLRAGDLIGSGTISGPARDALGSLLEITRGGSAPISLPSGERRTYLEDGDTVLLTARCQRDGYADIGFGECRGRVVPAATPP